MSALRKRLDPEERYGLRLTLAALAIILVAVPFAILTVLILGPGPVSRFDNHVAIGVNDHIHQVRWAVSTVRVVTHLGSAAVLAPLVALAAAFLWRVGARRQIVFLVVTASIGSLLNSAVKLLVHRARPVVRFPISTAIGKSFPSGHTLAATACLGAMYLALLPNIRREWRVAIGIVTGVIVVAVGASRVLLGVHFFTDVVGGFILGIAWLSASTAAFQVWRTEDRAATTHPDG